MDQGLLSGPSLGLLKSGQLGPDNNPYTFAHYFFQKKVLKPYFFILFVDKQGFVKKTNLDQIITLKKAKLGPDNSSTAHM